MKEVRTLLFIAAAFALILFFPIRWPSDSEQNREKMKDVFSSLVVGMAESKVERHADKFRELDFDVFLARDLIKISEPRRFWADTRNWHLLIGFDDEKRVAWAGFRYTREGNFRPCKAPSDLGESTMKTESCF